MRRRKRTSEEYILLHDITNALAHLIPIDTTPSHAHKQRLKPWSPLNHLLTHVILVRVACGSNILPDEEGVPVSSGVERVQFTLSDLKVLALESYELTYSNLIGRRC